MIYGDLGGFGTNGTNGTIVGHTEWHASGLWMLASSMETVYGKETTYNTKARYRRGVQSRHYSNAFRNYMYMYCMRKTVGVGEGRERGGRGVSCYAFCLFCEYLVVHHPQLLVLPRYLLHSMGPWGDCLKVSHLFRVCCYWKASPAVVNLECARWHSGHL